MEIVVLIKQVLATDSFVKIAEDGVSIETGGVKWVINPYDELALEEALRIKELHGGVVTVVSLGSDKAKEALRTAFAMGADKGILINDPEARGCDGLGTARIFSAVLKTLSYDLVITGQQVMDEDTFPIGPAVAEFLKIPNISLVIKENISGGRIRCHCTIDGGTTLVEADLPVLFTTQKSLNEPRYVSLPGIMKARRKYIDIRSLLDIGLEPSRVVSVSKIVAMRLPPQRRVGKIISGETVGIKAIELVRLLHEETKVI